MRHTDWGSIRLPGHSVTLICLNHAGDAFDWVKHVVQREPGITGSALLCQLESRFSSKLHLSEVVNRFFSDAISRTASDYFAMLKDAAYLKERHYMSLDALADRIASRSSANVRIIIWHSSEAIHFVFDISKIVERAIPTIYRTGSLWVTPPSAALELSSSVCPIRSQHH
ncbi:hypothetical protein PAEPH01_2110 [Pancytospora epiphaga]|nr:hypothetical protein PAEPH01_2110 [Pancytospora epiphaga]